MLSFYLSMVNDDNDKEKIERIYKKYKQLMYKKAFSILKHEQDAQDALHEAFIRIIKHLHNIHNTDDIKTQYFVMIITENISLKMLKQKNKIQSFNIDDFADTLPQTEPSKFDNVDKITIKNALEQLSEQHYHILCLTDYLGFSVKQAAVLLSISEDTAYKRLQRARIKMAELLGKEGLYV